MLAYSPIDSEEDIPCPTVSPPVQVENKTKPPVVNRAEVDYVVLAFVVGTLILIISDMIGKK